MQVKRDRETNKDGYYFEQILVLFRICVETALYYSLQWLQEVEIYKLVCKIIVFIIEIRVFLVNNEYKGNIMYLYEYNLQRNHGFSFQKITKDRAICCIWL